MKPIELPDGRGWCLGEDTSEEVQTVRHCPECERLLAAIKAHREAYAAQARLYDDHEATFTWDHDLWRAAGLE